MFDFFYGDSEQYMFYRVPQILFTDDRFKTLSCEAKLLYGFLLDRTSLSKKNGWIDKSGITFVYYKQELVQEQLNIGRDKAMRIFSELEKIGLIIRKKQGLGKPTKIFVMNFAKPIDKSDDEDEVICKINALTKSTKTQQKSDKSAQKDEPTSQRSEKSTSEKSKSTSRGRENRPLEVDKNDVRTSEISTYIHTELNHTELNHTNPSINQTDTATESTSEKIDRRIEEYEEYVQKAEIQISYYALLSQGYNQHYLNLIVNLLADTYVHRADNCALNINGLQINIADVARQYERIDDGHIEYIMSKLNETSKTQQIRNIRNYLRSCLYNAVNTMELDVDMQVNYDFEN